MKNPTKKAYVVFYSTPPERQSFIQKLPVCEISPVLVRQSFRRIDPKEPPYFLFFDTHLRIINTFIIHLCPTVVHSFLPRR